MKKQQIYVLSGGLILLLLLTFFGKTVNPKKTEVNPTSSTANTSGFNFEELKEKEKNSLDTILRQKITTLEAAVKMNTTADKVELYKQLANIWRDSAHSMAPYLFYTGEAAKLENSEKTLTFAAQQYLTSLLDVDNPAIQTWIATNAKALFDKALVINPNSDSSKIGLGACYILGNISDNPMTGLKPIKDILTQHPDNLFAHYILGLGGRKSGQFDKAIEHFLLLNQSFPNDATYLLHLAECYEQKHDKTNAVVYYKKAESVVDKEEIKKAIEQRINELK